jgi:hypothetical protein
MNTVLSFESGGAMGEHQQRTLHLIKGRQVNVALQDGTSIHDCNLVSSGRKRVESLWLVADGEDVIVALDDVVDVWETDDHRPRAA